MKQVRKYKYLLFVLLFLPFDAFAQFYTGSELSFGRKRVQYESFFWTYYRFNGFDVYFYKQGKNLAAYTANYVQNHLMELQNRIGYQSRDGIRFMIYNRLTDYKQSNIGYLDENQYNTGGVTKFLGNKVFLYFNGDYVDFENQIREGISALLIEQALKGASIASQYKSSYLMHLPSWFTEGLAAYYARGWDEELDEKMQIAVQQKKFKYITALTGADAIFAGHSFWYFIAQTYGEEAVSRCIRVLASERSMEKSVEYALNIKFKNLLKNWTEFYLAQDADKLGREAMPKGSRIKRTNRPNRIYQQMKLSPDGNKIAFVANHLGKAVIFLYDIPSAKRKQIYKMGASIDDKPDYSYPVLSWHPKGKILGIATEEKGKTTLHLYDVTKKRKQKVSYNIESYEKILDFQFSENAQNIVLSAVKQGQSDLFLFSLTAGTSKQITFDIYDDGHPRFLEAENDKIVFSSNRPNDSLRKNEKFETAPSLPPSHRLYVYDLEEESTLLYNLTPQKGINYSEPENYSSNYLSFLNNENGISNISLGKFGKEIASIDTSIHYRSTFDFKNTTNYTAGLRFFATVPNLQKATQTLALQGKNILQNIVLEEASLLYERSAIKAPPTKYKQVKIDKKNKFEIARMRDSIAKSDTSSFVTSGKRSRFMYLRQSRQSDIKLFDSTSLEKPENLLAQALSAEEQALQDSIFPKIPPKQYTYHVQYNVTEATAQLSFSFLNAAYQTYVGGKSPLYMNPGASAMTQITLMDLMENHRITGGFGFSFDFSTTEYLLSYENLEKRLGKQYVFHVLNINQNGQYPPYRQNSYDAYFILKYPLSEVSLIKGTVFARFDRTVFKAFDYNSLVEPNRYASRVGLRGEWIYDHSRAITKNIYYGLRGKVWGEYYQGVWKSSDNIFVLGADFRHYLPLFKTMIWANRAAVSTSFGQSRLIYYMGGVDGWIMPHFNQDVDVDPSQNYAYQTLATNLRGFSQNIRNGNTMFVFNSEIRFPIFACLSKAPLKNNFLRSFQVVLFGDIGSAWSNWNPWSKDNSFYKKKIENGALTITLEKDTNPFVGGFGAGLRAEVLGYFIRADVAWGVENRVVQRKPVFYFSFSTDF